MAVAEEEADCCCGEGGGDGGFGKVGLVLSSAPNLEW